MIKLILIIALIQYIINAIFKPKYTTLNCGIFAWAGKDLKHFNKQKFDIQGIYNDSRGGDSCGVTSDGEIYYGIHAGSKHYKDFLVSKNYIKPKNFPVVIGHTRKSSVGVINENNAHPFGFGVNEKYDSYDFIGVHNGTLYNHDEFCKFYDVDINVTNENKIFERRKIDSEVLLECIYKSKSFKVLSEYNGGAALLFTSTLEPNVIYAFHGASGDFKGDKLTEERPLYYYKESKNSLYISSLSESLVAIGGILDENVFEFEHNKVYKIKDGNIDSAEIFDISRVNAYQRKIVTYGSSSNFSRNFKTHDDCAYDDYDYFNNSCSTKKVNEVQKENAKEKISIDNIYDEKEEKFFKSPIIFHKLRYKRNGHLLNGIFTFVKGYGIVPLADGIIEPRNKNTIICELIEVSFDVKTGLFLKESSKDINFIPFPIGKTPPLLYMYDGILLEEELDYVALNQSKEKDYKRLSHCSKHPLITTDFKYKTNQEIYYKGSIYTGKICPLGSGKIYEIINGDLKSVEYIDEIIKDNVSNSNEPIKLPISSKNLTEQNDSDFLKHLNSVKDDLDKPIINFLEDENDDYEDSTNKEALDLTCQLLTEVFTEIQNVNTQLSIFDNINEVKETIEINQAYLETIDKLSLKLIK